VPTDDPERCNCPLCTARRRLKQMMESAEQSGGPCPRCGEYHPPFGPAPESEEKGETD